MLVVLSTITDFDNYNKEIFFVCIVGFEMNYKTMKISFTTKILNNSVSILIIIDFGKPPYHPHTQEGKSLGTVNVVFRNQSKFI